MKSIRRLFLLVALGAFLTVCVGCNGNVHISGKVTYPDGTPLSIGQIIFTDDFYMAKSDINKNGEYSLHSARRNDGIRRGTYRVYITGAMRFEESDDDSPSVGLAPVRMDRIVNLIDDQHMTADTSGWEYELKKSQKIDFTVYPPGKVPEEARTEAAKLFFDEEYRKKVKKERGTSFESEKKTRRVNPNLL